MPEDVVAIVKGGPSDPVGRHLTYEGFCLAAAQQALGEMKRQRSGARQVLEQLLEEAMVRQACQQLGIDVTVAEMQARWKEWDGQLRLKSNGQLTLRETIEKEGSTEREFIEQIYHMMRKERIAAHPKYLGKKMPANDTARLQQIGIVIATIRKSAVVRYGVETIDTIQQGVKPEDIGPGVVAMVNDEKITMQTFGDALVVRLPGNQVREYLDRECKTALMSIERVGLSDEELDAEIAHLEELWPLERELQREEVWRTVSFKDRFETQFSMTLEDVKKSRYSRGLLGLVRRMRAEITAADVQKEYETEKEGRYGPYILVWDVSIEFAQRDGFTTGGRTLKEAHRLANDYARRLARGETFEKLAGEVNGRRDRTLQAKKIRLTKTNQDLVLHQQAARLLDNDVSTPFETLAEVHVMKREGQRPARTLGEVAPHVRELLARRRAREWIEEKVKEPAWVRIRWPLPQRR